MNKQYCTYSNRSFHIFSDLLYEGANKFLNHDQLESGADLSGLLLDTLEKSKDEKLNDWLPKLKNLLTKIGPSVVERESILVSIYSPN
jgi:Golgi to ER traffic protein 4